MDDQATSANLSPAIHCRLLNKTRENLEHIQSPYVRFQLYIRVNNFSQSAFFCTPGRRESLRCQKWL